MFSGPSPQSGLQKRRRAQACRTHSKTLRASKQALRQWQALTEYYYDISIDDPIRASISAPGASILGMRGAFPKRANAQPQSEPLGPPPRLLLPPGCRLPCLGVATGNHAFHMASEGCATRGSRVQAAARCGMRVQIKEAALATRRRKSGNLSGGLSCRVIWRKPSAWAASRWRRPPSIRSPGLRCARTLRI